MSVFVSDAPQIAANLPMASALEDRLQKQFGELLELIGAICETKAGMIHLFGGKYTKKTSDGCFCSSMTTQQGPYVVSDLREDPRLFSHIHVTGEPNLRFYAGYPLTTSNQKTIGNVCIVGHEHQQMTTIQQSALRAIARQISAHVELTTRLVELETASRHERCVMQELEATNSLFRSFLNASPVSAFIKDDTGRMTYCNKALADRFGATPEDWIGSTDFEIWPREIAEEFRRTDLLVLEHNREFHFEDWTLGADGRVVSWDVHKYPFVDASGRRSVACMALDTTPQWEAQQEVQRVQKELQVANEQLRALSLSDPLTGLLNRRALEGCLENELARCRRSGEPLSILMADIDNFKNYNDSFGHVCGDEALREVSAIMRQWARQSDLVARYGGEEFLVILPATDTVGAVLAAERLREEVRSAVWRHRSITVSVGVATLHERIFEITDLIHEADKALYTAKRNGRNRVCVVDCYPKLKFVEGA